MIDVRNEQLLSIRKSPQHFPQNPKPSGRTVTRWATEGCHGVKLEFVQIGATRFTSVEAIRRFLEACMAQGLAQ